MMIDRPTQHALRVLMNDEDTERTAALKAAAGPAAFETWARNVLWEAVCAPIDWTTLRRLLTP